MWLVQEFRPATDNTGQSLSAREILDQRYAKGELSREEYQERLQDISQT